MSAWLITLPEPTAAAVVALVVAAVGVLIRWLATYVDWLAVFLEKYKEEWGTALGVLLVNVIQAYLPGGEWADSMILLVQLAVAVLTVLLGKVVLTKAGAKGLM